MINHMQTTDRDQKPSFAFTTEIENNAVYTTWTMKILASALNKIM